MPEDRSKPNILIVHNRYQLPGGEDTVVENEKRLLEENGPQVFSYIRNPNLKGLRGALLPLTMFYNPKTFFDIRRIIRENHIDIVHVHNTAHVISPAVYYAAKSLGIPVVKTIHNYRMQCPAGTFYREGKICEVCKNNRFGTAIKHGCYRGSRLQTLAVVLNMKLHRAAGIFRDLYYIALSEFGKEHLLSFHQIDPEHVYVKPNFTFREGPEGMIPVKKRGYYLFSGRLEEIKGILLAVEAFRQMPDRKFVAAGEGPLMDGIRAFLKEEHIQNTELPGWIPHREMREKIRGAAALIACPQMYDVFPLTILEAFAEHTPVISGDIGNLKNIVKDKYNGIRFQYDSVQSLMDAIAEFEESDRETMAENAYRSWEENYSPEINYRTLRDIYTAILRSAHGE